MNTYCLLGYSYALTLIRQKLISDIEIGHIDNARDTDDADQRHERADDVDQRDDRADDAD